MAFINSFAVPTYSANQLVIDTCPHMLILFVFRTSFYFFSLEVCGVDSAFMMQ